MEHPQGVNNHFNLLQLPTKLHSSQQLVMSSNLLSKLGLICLHGLPPQSLHPKLLLLQCPEVVRELLSRRCPRILVLQHLLLQITALYQDRREVDLPMVTWIVRNPRKFNSHHSNLNCPAMIRGHMLIMGVQESLLQPCNQLNSSLLDAPSSSQCRSLGKNLRRQLRSRVVVDVLVSSISISWQYLERVILAKSCLQRLKQRRSCTPSKC